MLFTMNWLLNIMQAPRFLKLRSMRNLPIQMQVRKLNHEVTVETTHSNTTIWKRMIRNLAKNLRNADTMARIPEHMCIQDRITNGNKSQMMNDCLQPRRYLEEELEVLAQGNVPSYAQSLVELNADSASCSQYEVFGKRKFRDWRTHTANTQTTTDYTKELLGDQSLQTKE